MSRRLRVVKLGGSLLGDARLPRLARHWLDSEPEMSTVVIVGGGVWVDGVRNAYQTFSLDEAFCHWLCVDLLEQTSRLGSKLLGIPHTDDWQQLLAPTTNRSTVFRCGRFLREIEPTLGEPALEHSWTVTTDSIAARIARLAEADELVLWKSAPPPETSDRNEWARANYVDTAFPIASQELSVRAVNLLSSGDNRH
jgi:5-(aminomethyl)-3-furanmethanol phosphate kinase